tara:strand:+ start:113 stop:379 length:267 start_codon:yes stop_codon:yes gene_type:complete
MLKPVNRYILVDYKPPEEKSDSGILLPDDYKPPEEHHAVVKVLGVSDDIPFFCAPGDRIVIDKKMLEEIRAEHSSYYLILANYVLGVL